MAVVLDCIDYAGRQVRLTDTVWYGHILMEHPELRANERSVELALVSPHQVNRDKDFADREVFYRRGALPPPDKNDYLNVVVRYRETDEGVLVGQLLTAYAIRAILPEEPILWSAPRSSST
jgi:hypothetical protein